MAIQGIIRPPPDIRVVADKTAMFVAKNGRAFEQRILGSAKGKTPKFAFLQPTSPFHAYYEDRIKHFSEGGTAEDEPKKKDDKQQDADSKPSATKAAKPQKDKVTKQKASIIDPVAKAILGQRAAITNHLKKEKEKRQNTASAAQADDAADGDAPEPPKSEAPLPLPAPPKVLDTVHVVAPYHLTPTQIETIQLVAQFVAMDGKGGPFLPALVSREWSNPEFGFCQPRNIHFSYFSALVDAYRKIVADYVEASKEATKQEEKPESNTRYTFQAALDDAAYRTEYERELERRRQKQQENSSGGIEDGEIASAIDWHDFVVVETIDFPKEEQVDLGLSMLPTKKATTTAQVAPEATAPNDDMEESSDEEDDSNIRVVPSYTPKVVGTYDPSTARAVDPLTGKSVAVADMPEHMRIQLLDPKWAEERKKFQDKQKDSNLVGGDAVVANFARMSSDAPKPAKAAVPMVGPAPTPKQEPHVRPLAAEPPAAKRQRTNIALPPPLLQQQHKVTIAPPLVAHPQASNAAAPMPAPAPEAMEAEAPPPAAAAAAEPTLLSADEFIQSLGENPVVELQIRIPNDAASQNWNFFGQTVTLEGINPRLVVKEVKELLSKQHLNNMPVNKIQLRSISTDGDSKGKFLNNNTTLAALNIGPKALLELKSKQRGGRKN